MTDPHAEPLLPLGAAVPSAGVVAARTDRGPGPALRGSDVVARRPWGAWALLAILVGLVVRGWTVVAPSDVWRDRLDLALDVATSPMTFVALAGILLLETAFPADRSQRLLSPALLQDLVWFLLWYVAWTALTFAYFVPLYSVVSDHLGGVRGAFQGLPRPLLVVAAVLLGDLTGWFLHLVKHRVPLFWRFHELHHSQAQLNLFTDQRNHPVDLIVPATITYAAAFVLSLNLPEITVYATFQLWYVRLVHANVRANLGPLRYVLVTPQSHRIHHSRQPEQFDRNFAGVFSIWDRLFRTHCDDPGYPPTGLDDPAFPLEHGFGPGSVLRTTWAQLAYPFRVRSAS